MHNEYFPEDIHGLLVIVTDRKERQCRSLMKSLKALNTLDELLLGDYLTSIREAA